jgi:hypothetical protein
MNGRIVRALVTKEALRHLAHPGGLLVLAGLVTAALLLSLLGGTDGLPGALPLGARVCYVDYWQEDALLEQLRRHVPDELGSRVQFRPATTVPTDQSGIMQYPLGAVAIQLRGRGPEGERYQVSFWHSGSQAALAPYEAWFWKQAYQISRAPGGPAPLPPLHSERQSLLSGSSPRTGLATALILFGLFFLCVYLLPSLTCEERENGTLLAQALSPASVRDILAAKLVFYGLLGASLATVVAATLEPIALVRPSFWLSLVVSVVGAQGIGLSIASLARTQRQASLGALAYSLAVALGLFACKRADLPLLPELALEHHCPQLLQASLSGNFLPDQNFQLEIAAAMAFAWLRLAAFLFRRLGWQ